MSDKKKRRPVSHSHRSPPVTHHSSLIVHHSSLITYHSSLPRSYLHPVEACRAADGGERDACRFDVAALDRAAEFRPLAPVRAEGEAVTLAALRRHAQVDHFGLRRVGARQDSLVFALAPPDRDLAAADGDARSRLAPAVGGE